VSDGECGAFRHLGRPAESGLSRDRQREKDDEEWERGEDGKGSSGRISAGDTQTDNREGRTVKSKSKAIAGHSMARRPM